MTKRLFVLMYDPTEQICPVEADTPDDAYRQIAERLGISIAEAQAWPLYDGHDDDDLATIAAILASHIPGGRQ